MRQAALMLGLGALAALALAALAVQGPDRFLGEFSGDGRLLTNLQARVGMTLAAWASPWGVQVGGSLAPADTMTPSTMWAVTSAGDLRVAATATNGVDGCWEFVAWAVRPKALEE